LPILLIVGALWVVVSSGKIIAAYGNVHETELVDPIHLCQELAMIVTIHRFS